MKHKQLRKAVGRTRFSYSRRSKSPLWGKLKSGRKNSMYEFGTNRVKRAQAHEASWLSELEK